MKTFFTTTLSALLVAACCSFAVAADERNVESFKKHDADSDGKLTLAEFSEGAEDKDAAAAEFKKLDKDSGSSLSEAEYTAK